jgi:hypothetical protein
VKRPKLADPFPPQEPKKRKGGTLPPTGKQKKVGGKGKKMKLKYLKFQQVGVAYWLPEVLSEDYFRL